MGNAILEGVSGGHRILLALIALMYGHSRNFLGTATLRAFAAGKMLVVYARVMHGVSVSPAHVMNQASVVDTSTRQWRYITVESDQWKR